MFLTRTADLLYDSVLALLYPQQCVVCGGSVSHRRDGVACSSCWAKVRTFQLDDTLCWKCGALSLGNVTEAERERVRCRRCDSYPFSAARACGVYEGALRASVLELKRNPYLGNRLIRMVAELQQQPPLNTATVIIPVPLHRERERSRGFNQSTIIGRELSRLSGLPFRESCLIRTRHSERHRAGMDARGRRETVEDAFEVCYPLMVAGESVLLVDDVFTTGATASSCAGSLLSAGALEVFVLTLARPL